MLLEYMLTLFLIFWETPIFFTIVTASVYILTNSAQGSFLHIFVNT